VQLDKKEDATVFATIQTKTAPDTVVLRSGANEKLASQLRERAGSIAWLASRRQWRFPNRILEMLSDGCYIRSMLTPRRREIRFVVESRRDGGDESVIKTFTSSAKAGFECVENQGCAPKLTQDTHDIL
jgi:hypothetical protein